MFIKNNKGQDSSIQNAVGKKPVNHATCNQIKSFFFFSVAMCSLQMPPGRHFGFALPVAETFLHIPVYI